MGNKWVCFNDRFWSKVKKTSKCWLWTGLLSPTGYGSISVGGKSFATHRLSYEIHVKKIPKGMFVLHKCDVRNCLNPKHLFLGTALMNTRDMIQKGRQHFPTRKSHCKNGHKFEEGSYYKREWWLGKSGKIYMLRVCKKCRSIWNSKYRKPYPKYKSVVTFNSTERREA